MGAIFGPFGMDSSFWQLWFPNLSPEKRREDGARNWYKIKRSETLQAPGQKLALFMRLYENDTKLSPAFYMISPAAACGPPAA
jgi:hypothetical protein